MKSVRGLRLHYVVIFASLVAALTGRPAVAQDTWISSSGGDWNTLTVPNVAGATAIIPVGFPNAGATINIGSAVVIKALQLKNNFMSSITGSSITFDNSGCLGSILFNTGTWTISNNLILIDPLNVTTTANGVLNGVISGTQSLQKLAAGTLILGGANSYSGGTTISAGILQGTTTSLQGDIANGTNLVFD
jgi:autotransporter-associated beta strand protein